MAVCLVSEVATVIIPITLELFGDTFAILTQELVGTRAVSGTVLFIRHVPTVILSVTNPVSLDARAVLTLKLIL